MPINRRKVLGGAGLAGAAAATGVGVDRLITGGTSGYRIDREEPIPDDAARFGDPRLPAETITSQSHLFHLGDQPHTTYDGGSFQQADEDNFPILKGQEASIVLLTLEPGGIREPHWHPSAWEINIVTKGVARGSSSTGTATTRVSTNTSVTSCSHPRVPSITSRTGARTT